jgi:hypothetical protein
MRQLLKHMNTDMNLYFQLYFRAKLMENAALDVLISFYHKYTLIHNKNHQHWFLKYLQEFFV